ncbi:PepSY domain-containing protein [Paenibacillus sp. L3-i20]|uniref:PepSY domain-containing protein n=1 Tax=Paenibacillus sp. L3-i20 TaxID=2905833 RepID=UPI001EDD4FAF|nr:PepSY domain-containing protein [Paenibacillus sp. L3-i20]GKU76439.1 hypothetical protein L3i20_v208360 [Paenibacillus sp. L3-i20]
MMKKRIALVGALSVAVLVGGVIGASAVQPASASGGAKKEVLIGVNKAKEAATKVVAGRVEGVELEREGGRVYYEVEIETTKRVEYDVLIDAYTGATISSKLDDNDDDDRVVVTTAVKPAQSGNTSNSNKATHKITADQAGKLAVAHVGGTIVKVKSDQDDGQPTYEVKLVVNGVKTEVEVNAVSGKIIDVDRDDDNDDNDDDHDDINDNDNDDDQDDFNDQDDDNDDNDRD